MAYDLNPNDLIKGKWKTSKETLTFGNEKLQSTGGKGSKKGVTLEFKRKGKSVIYGFNIGMPPSVLFGWDEGVAAVVINHEEQY